MKFYGLFKRLFDFIISLIAIVFLLPVFLIIVIVIKLRSKGPAVRRETGV